MWKVPLVDRVGAGYVYSSSHLDADRAEAELRAQLGPAADNAPARHLAARTGRRRRSWVGNCVAIGLSSGFVEPLEATGIYFIERAVASMVDGLRSGDRDRFNEMMTASYEEVRDLIVMHYLVNDRQDTTFWRATKEITVPSSLAARLETWRHRPPAAADFPRPAVFGVTTWMSVLAGMGFWREPFDDTASVIVSDEVERARRRLLDESTDHRRLLAAGA